MVLILAIVIGAGLASCGAAGADASPARAIETGSTPLVGGLGGVAGIVTKEADGTPLVGATVAVYDEAEEEVASATSGPGGSYEASGLPAGEYRVVFSDPGYARQYYDARTTLAQADRIAVPEGSVAENIDASLQRTGALGGTVTSSVGGAGLEGIAVAAYNAAGEVAAGTTTASGGHYEFESLEPGAYRIRFASLVQHYLTQYDGAVASLAEANPVVVGEGGEVEGVDAELVAAAEIEGEVISAQTKLPLEGIEVTAYDSAGEEAGSAVTGPTGRYTLAGLACGCGWLPAGSYRLRFSSGFGGEYLTQYYSGRAALLEADPVAAHSGEITGGINAEMRSGGHITGRVTLRASGAPLSGILARAYQPDGTEVPEASATTEPSGEYSIGPLPPGEYKVGFSTQFGEDFEGQYYDASARLGEAATITVTEAANTSEIDAALRTPGAISGTVTDGSTKAAVAGIEVAALDSEGQPVGFAQTAASGRYTIAALPAGSYRVEFSSGSATNSYLTQYFKGKTALAEATSVSVEEGKLKSAVNASMARAGAIAGEVTSSTTSSPLAAVQVAIYNAARQQIRSTTTNGEGRYDVEGLANGAYEVGFAASGTDFLSQFYNDRSTLASAQPVSVHSGGGATEVDAALRPGGQISGRVTGAPASEPLEDIEVTAYNGDEEEQAATVTNTNGEYDIQGLPTGSYRLAFQALLGDTWLTQYYGDHPTLHEAEPVEVQEGQTASGANAVLRKAGAITGRVLDASTSEPVAGVEVTAYDSAGEEVAQATSSVGGAYEIAGLAEGSYAIGFSDQEAGYTSSFYDNALQSSEATQVVVHEGATTAHVDAALERTGALAGKVLNNKSEPLANIAVTSYNAAQEEVALVETNAQGEYEISDLPAGPYRVGFATTDTEGYVPQYYNSHPQLAEAEAVTVSGGETTAGIDATLQQAAQIEGEVTSARTDKPVEGIQVAVYDEAGEEVAFATTKPDGTYVVQGLAPGVLRVGFSSLSGTETYLEQFYDSKGALSEATSLTLREGDAVAGIDAAMLTTAAAAPSISEQPTSTTVTVGQAASFSAAATGEPAPRIQWEMSKDGGVSYQEIPGATGASLVVPSATLADSGQEYRAIFTNSQGAATTEAATLTVTTGTAPTNTERPTVSGKTTAGASLTCTNGSWTGNPGKFAYAWTRDGIAVTTDSTAKYRITARDLGHTIACSVTAVNTGGSATATAQGVLVPAPGCSDYWIGTSGGSWSTPGDWSTGRAPTATTEACIIANGTYTVTLEESGGAGPVTLASLKIGGGEGTQQLVLASSCSEGAVLEALDGAAIAARGSVTMANGEGCSNGVVIDGDVVDGGTLAIEGPNGGARAIVGNLTNSKRLILGERTKLSVDGSFTETPAAALRSTVSGPGGIGAISTTGPATIGGRLELNQLQTFKASVGETFELLTTPAAAGTFGSETGGRVGGAGVYFEPLSLPGAIALQISQATLQLSATSGPPTTIVTLHGSGFPPGDMVTPSFLAHGREPIPGEVLPGERTVFPSVKADSQGAFESEVALPPGTTLGKGRFSAKSTLTGVIAREAFLVN